MNALTVIAEAAAAGVALEPRGERLGIAGPRDAVARLRAEIVAHRDQLLALLREATGCARCGEPVWRATADGSGWCRRDDHRRYLLDLAQLAGHPRLNLAPRMVYTVPAGDGGWAEFARAATGATLYVARRGLLERLGERAAEVAPSESPLRPWAA